jgi:dihydroflavonol-4-reductase
MPRPVAGPPSESAMALILTCLLLAGTTRALTPKDGCVVVTGATGYVAGHIIEVLLQQGYDVRGTVRDPNDKEKSAHLWDLVGRQPPWSGSLSLYKADLLDDAEAYAEVMDGCAGLLHVASPATFSAHNAYEGIVRPAVEGTVAVLEAAAAAGTIKSVVVTSSSMATRPTKAKTNSGLQQAYDESDWNDVATVSYGAYAYSKVQAERVAYEFVETRKPGFGPLKTILFPMAIGPQQNARVTSSNQ